MLSYYTQWTLLLAVSFSVILLYRKSIEMRRERMSIGLGRSDLGFHKGERFPVTEFQLRDGSPYSLVGTKQSLVIFASATCIACESILARIQNFQKKFPDLRILIIIEGTDEQVANKIEKHDLELPIFHMKREEAPLFKNPPFPFAYLLTPDAKVIHKGVTNTMDHLYMLISHGSNASPNQLAAE